MKCMKTKRYICSEICHRCRNGFCGTFVGYVEDEDNCRRCRCQCCGGICSSNSNNRCGSRCAQ